MLRPARSRAAHPGCPSDPRWRRRRPADLALLGEVRWRPTRRSTCRSAYATEMSGSSPDADGEHGVRRIWRTGAVSRSAISPAAAGSPGSARVPPGRVRAVGVERVVPLARGRGPVNGRRRVGVGLPLIADPTARSGRSLGTGRGDRASRSPARGDDLRDPGERHERVGDAQHGVIATSTRSPARLKRKLAVDVLHGQDPRDLRR